MNWREYISKRILGAISYTIALGMSISDGFDWYDADPMLVLNIFGGATLLLGFDTWKAVKTN